MTSGYLVYPHPTIVEAICDIRFRLAPRKRWRPSFPGELFKHIQDEYPEMEAVPDVGLQLEVEPLSPRVQVVAQRPKVCFKHSSRALLLQLAENSLTVNTLLPYPGWQVMRSDVLTIWQKVAEVVRPEMITRLGVRYINRIVKETEQDCLGTWLTENAYIPKGLLEAHPGFLLRVETYLDEENRLILTLGDTKSEGDGPYGAIIFDIDRMVKREIVPEQDALEQELNRLHVAVWEVFSSAQGEKLEALINRRPE
jgi:uncharacterized protein (TIGR04255 family)